MKVKNMTNPRTGREVPNQFVIETNERVVNKDGNFVDKPVEYFQSYNAIIVRICDGLVELDSKSWNCSKTTSKYRNQFLGETTKETQAKIDSGEYLLTDLN